jgi:integrase
VQQYRAQLDNPALKYNVGQVTRGSAPVAPPWPIATPQAAPVFVQPEPAKPTVAPDFATLTAIEAGEKYVADNPKLMGAGKREGKWTDKTLSQFRTAMRLVQKSIGTKPFWTLSRADIQQLLVHFDGLPPNHHKTPRHDAMTLAEICQEAQDEIKAGRLHADKLGLNIPTLNRHFRFIRAVHDWMGREVDQVERIDWSQFIFTDTRSAREQRVAFPVELGRKLFRLPPWHGCSNRLRRFRPGREIIHDSVYWVLPIIWYSGMRREEACKLQVTDVGNEDGIWFFDVDDTEAGRVKSNSSKRRIPVADELIRLGFIAFLDACKGAGRELLFPELVSGTRRMGDTYYRLCWNHLMAALGDEAEGLTLHGIRHMVADELKAAGVNEEARADLLGHTLASETAGRYSKASRLNNLAVLVNKIPVVTSTVKPAGRINLLG